MAEVPPSFRRFLALLLLGSAGSLWADEEPPLPTWDMRPTLPGQMPEGAPAPIVVPENEGALLLPPAEGTDFFPQLGPDRDVTSLMIDEGGLNPHDLSLFLRGGLLSAHPAPSTIPPPTPTGSLRDLPLEHLRTAAAAPANEYLMDPQSLVTEVLRLDLDRLLEFHGSDARIKLYILVLDRDQKLPAEADLDSLAHGALTRGDSCLAIYPLGEPWRTRYLMSRSVIHSLAQNELADLADDCTQDAMLATDSMLQLQRFAVHLSTRLFKLERHLSPRVQETTAAPLDEVTRSPSLDKPVAVKPWGSWGWVLLTAGLAGLTWLIVLTLHLAFKSRHRLPAAVTQVWLLAEPEIPSRLGGAFSGGGGASGSFGKP